MVTAEAGGASRSFAVDGRAFPAPALVPGLYLVATPIGHLGDVSLRALATLAAADTIACEDTRVTRVLLDRYAIRVPLLAYHEHNAEKQRPRLLAALAEGKSVALVSDAGTPLVSDPGYRLVAAATAAGHKVVPVPGASALLAALVVAGLPTDTFLFAGFLPPKSAARQKRLQALKAVPATLLFYESPHRLAETLADMAAVLGDRRAVVARELTKAFEEVRRGTLAGLAADYGASETPKGEIVVVVGPPEETAPEAADVDALLLGLIPAKGVKGAADEAAALTGLSRRDLYRRALDLKDRTGGGTG